MSDVPTLDSYIRAVPSTYIQAGILGSIVTGHPLGATFSSGMLANSLINMATKTLSKKIFGSIGSRPDPPDGGCGEFYNPLVKGSDVTSYGFPSGHSSAMGFATAFWLFFMWKELSNRNSLALVFMTIALLIIALVVIFSRIRFKCHTLTQVVVGTMMGSGLGIGFYYLLETDRKTFYQF
jgi:membrane-associated phospholipid phosphatase